MNIQPTTMRELLLWETSDGAIHNSRPVARVHALTKDLEAFLGQLDIDWNMTSLEELAKSMVAEVVVLRALLKVDEPEPAEPKARGCP